MTQPQSLAPSPAEQRQMALSRWDSDGGAGLLGPQEDLVSGDIGPNGPDLANAELVKMRIRLIALENLVIALLGGASEHQIELAREAAAYISPRPGTTPHPMTLRAASQMNHLIQQAAHFRSVMQP